VRKVVSPKKKAVEIGRRRIYQVFEKMFECVEGRIFSG